MKTIITLIAIGLGYSLANAQNVKEADVPTEVKDAFKKQYPTAKAEEWEKEGLNYEAEFHQNKIEISVVYDSHGNLIETETEMKVSDLPKNVTEYIAKNLPGKSAKEASKIIASNGKVSYEAEVDNVDYIFDENGKLIRQETEDEADDKD